MSLLQEKHKIGCLVNSEILSDLVFLSFSHFYFERLFREERSRDLKIKESHTSAFIGTVMRKENEGSGTTSKNDDEEKRRRKSWTRI